MEPQPLHVSCAASGADPHAQLLRREDGDFQVVVPGRLDALVSGPDYVLAEAGLASELARLCAPDLEIRPVVIRRPKTGETVTTHSELVAALVVPAGQAGSPWPTASAFRVAGSLFVAPRVRDGLVALGRTELRFSPGLERFAG